MTVLLFASWLLALVVALTHLEGSGDLPEFDDLPEDLGR